MDRLATELPEHCMVGTFFDRPAGGCMMIVKKSFIDSNGDPEHHILNEGRVHRWDFMAGGQAIRLLNVHIGPGIPYRDQVEQLESIAGHCSNDGATLTIMAGDFNFQAEGECRLISGTPRVLVMIVGLLVSSNMPSPT